MVIGAGREDGLDDHSGDAGVEVIGGGTTAVGSGGSQGLVEGDGSDESEARRVVLVGSHAGEALLVGVQHGGFQDLQFFVGGRAREDR